LVALVGDPQTTPDERVQAANYLRLHQETAAAQEQLELALKAKPAHSAAVVSRAFLLAEAKKTAEAVALLHGAIAAAAQPPAVFLMLAAIENARAPDASAALSAAMAALDQGLKAHPDSLDLARAKYGLLRSAG